MKIIDYFNPFKEFHAISNFDRLPAWDATFDRWGVVILSILAGIPTLGFAGIALFRLLVAYEIKKLDAKDPALKAKFKKTSQVANKTLQNEQIKQKQNENPLKTTVNQQPHEISIRCTKQVENTSNPSASDFKETIQPIQKGNKFKNCDPYHLCSNVISLLEMALNQANSELINEDMEAFSIPKAVWKIAVFNLILSAKEGEEDCREHIQWGDIHVWDALECEIVMRNQKKKTIYTVDGFSAINRPAYPVALKKTIANLSSDQRSGLKLVLLGDEKHAEDPSIFEASQEISSLADVLENRYKSSFLFNPQVEINPVQYIIDKSKDASLFPEHLRMISHFNDLWEKIFESQIKSLLSKKIVSLDDLSDIDTPTKVVKLSLIELFSNCLLDERKGKQELWFGPQICLTFQQILDVDQKAELSSNIRHFAFHQTNELTSHTMTDDPQIVEQPVEFAKQVQLCKKRLPQIISCIEKGIDLPKALPQPFSSLLETLSTFVLMRYSVTLGRIVQGYVPEEISPATMDTAPKDDAPPSPKPTQLAQNPPIPNDPMGDCMDALVKQEFDVVPNNLHGSCVLLATLQEMNPSLRKDVSRQYSKEELKQKQEEWYGKTNDLRKKLVAHLKAKKNDFMGYVMIDMQWDSYHPTMIAKQRNEIWAACSQNTDEAKLKAIDERLKYVLKKDVFLMEIEINALADHLKRRIHIYKRKSAKIFQENNLLRPHVIFGEAFTDQPPIHLYDDCDHYKLLIPKNPKID